MTKAFFLAPRLLQLHISVDARDRRLWWHTSSRLVAWLMFLLNLTRWLTSTGTALAEQTWWQRSCNTQASKPYMRGLLAIHCPSSPLTHYNWQSAGEPMNLYSVFAVLTPSA